MIVIVMGVSGSGKSVVGRALAARLGWEFEDADDWHPAANVAKMRSGQALTDEDRTPWLRSLNAEIRKHVAGERDLVLACSALKARYRLALVQDVSHRSVRFVYLKGTLNAIQSRLKQRQGHFMPDSLLASQFETLEEPSANEALAVDASLPVADAVTAIIGQLREDGFGG